MTYDPIDEDADGAYDTNELTVNTLNGLDLNANVGGPLRVDGDTVFSAQTPPVAYSNLVAWYPFDAAEYGGSNADDVTAIIGGSGDDTAHDGTVNGASYQSSGGVTDINAGADSGAFDFDGSNDNIVLPSGFFDSTTTFSLSLWFEQDSISSARVFNSNDDENGFRIFARGDLSVEFEDSGTRVGLDTSPSYSTGTPVFVCVTFDGSTAKAYIASSGILFQNYDSLDTSGSGSDPVNPTVGAAGFEPKEFFNGRIDDVRIYDKALSSTEVETIYLNTEP
jgi:hypothetical protein